MTPRRAEVIISTLLRIGVVLSVLIIVAGTLLTFIHHREYVSSPAELIRLSLPGEAVPQTIRGVFTGVLELRGQSIVAAGLLLLILTPVFRVAASILIFLVERDRIYVAITSAVLLLLLVSFFLGHVLG